MEDDIPTYAYGGAASADRTKARLLDAMRSAGIGQRFLNLSLRECGEEGNKLADLWTSKELSGLLAKGFGFTFHGPASVALSMATARACVLLDTKTQVVWLGRLVQALRDDSTLAPFEEADVLLILGFVDDSGDDTPLTRGERLSIETLIRERIDECQPTLIQAELLPTTKAPLWWSSSLIRQLGTVNQVVEAR